MTQIASLSTRRLLRVGASASWPIFRGICGAFTEGDIKPWALRDLYQQHFWAVQRTEDHMIVAATINSPQGPPVFHMARGHQGVLWKLAWIDTNFEASVDCGELKVWEKQVGFTFVADPRISRYPRKSEPRDVYHLHRKSHNNERNDLMITKL